MFLCIFFEYIYNQIDKINFYVPIFSSKSSLTYNKTLLQIFYVV